jgi:nicotinamidase-related amidase
MEWKVINHQSYPPISIQVTRPLTSKLVFIYPPHFTMPSNTAIIIIDPYNDFLHPQGKLNPLLADSLKETDAITHLKELVTAARLHKIPIYYGLHQQCKAGFIAGWNHATPMQKSQKENVAFEEGSWGVDIYEGLEPSLENGDVVVSKHWSSRYK